MLRPEAKLPGGRLTRQILAAQIKLCILSQLRNSSIRFVLLLGQDGGKWFYRQALSLAHRLLLHSAEIGKTFKWRKEHAKV